jgi:hypothetical protein
MAWEIRVLTLIIVWLGDRHREEAIHFKYRTVTSHTARNSERALLAKEVLTKATDLTLDFFWLSFVHLIISGCFSLACETKEMCRLWMGEAWGSEFVLQEADLESNLNCRDVLGHLLPTFHATGDHMDMNFGGTSQRLLLCITHVSSEPLRVLSGLNKPGDII